MESFRIKPEIYFGDGALSAFVRYQGQRVFIVADPFVVKSGMITHVTEQLPSCEIKIFDDIVPDPPIETIAKGILAFEQFKPSVVAAVGGGSAIDAAKAIRFFADGGKDSTLAAIPTTSGTGSEMTSFAVLTDKKTGRKYPVVMDDLLPEAAILDAALVKTVPPAVTADTGMDVLTHAVEAYVSTKASAFSDALAQKAVAYVFSYLESAYQGDDEARARMHEASAMAGIAFNAASLGLNHAIAHNLGGRLGLPHGRVNAILMPHVIAFNAEDKTAAARYAFLGAIARRAVQEGRAKRKATVGTIGAGNGNFYSTVSGGLGTVMPGVRDFIEQIERLMRCIHMPLDFKACGVAAEKIEEVKAAAAAGALLDGCMATNPRTVTAAQIEAMIVRSGGGSVWRQKYY